MAHQSGFIGSIVLTGGPTSLAAVITKWTLNQTTRNHEAYVKNDTWKKKFATVSEWDADVEFLLPDGVTPGTQLITGQTITTLNLIMVTGNYYAATASSSFIESFEIDDPLDGPVTIRAKICGKGFLSAVAA